MTSPKGLNYPKAKRQSQRWWTQRSATMLQKRIYQSRRKRRKCKVTDSTTMGLATPWYHRGETFVESSIPCSHGGRALVVKQAEEVENVEANSKYYDKAEDQMPRNFIKLASIGSHQDSRKWRTSG
ncbi:hypothetical protein BHE74_00001108 [Ensete ventricosum]|nr:hypothetical protein GW17_00001649 [Ensete ventricosum]RWW89837.1 hypothetical protein BHE74_00001108 [Ensete ventricosum]RZS17973.1 hypothetical protein BHM03_00050184 [Ensete ventricosum]